MSIRVATKDLIGLLATLAHTAADLPELGAVAGILLHTTRGYLGDEPGKSGLLVGTSTDTRVIGHTSVLCSGSGEPMLWPIGEVGAAIKVLQQMSKKDSEHRVEILRDGQQVTLAEDGNLFGAGASFTFDLGDAGKYPRHVWRMLSDAHLRPVVKDPDSGEPIPVGVRTDVAGAALAPFLAVAKARKECIQLVRHHQRLPVQVVIGHNYRGAFRPETWAEDLDITEFADGAVYPAELPEPLPEDKPARLNLRDGSGLVVVGASGLESVEPPGTGD